MTKRLCFCLPILIFSLLGFTLSATARIVKIGDKEYIERVWRTDDGLPQNSVTSIVQTRDGYIWVGTFGGLARFDGVKFTLFNSGNTRGLSGNRIVSLYEDTAGVLWIGFESGGMARYADGKFTSYTTKDGAPNGSLRISRADANGNLWIVSLAGNLSENRLHIFKDGRFRTFSEKDSLPGGVIGLVADRSGKIWVSTERGLFLEENEQFRLMLETKDATNIQSSADGGLWLSSNNFIGLYKEGSLSPLTGVNQTGDEAWRAFENNRQLWLLKDRAQPAYFKDGQIVQVDLPPIIRSIITDHEGNLWIGALGGGLIRLREKKLKTYTRADGLISNDVSAITEDNAGSLWIANYQLIEIKNGTLRAYPETVGVTTLFADTDGSLWFNTKAHLAHRQGDKLTEYTETRFPKPFSVTQKVTFGCPQTRA